MSILFRDYGGLRDYHPPTRHKRRPKKQQDAPRKTTIKRRRLRWGPRLAWSNPNPPIEREKHA